MSCLFLSKVTLQSCLFFLVKGNSSELLPLLRQPLPCVLFWFVPIWKLKRSWLQIIDCSKKRMQQIKARGLVSRLSVLFHPNLRKVLYELSSSQAAPVSEQNVDFN